MMHRRRPREDRGASLVEAAIITPVFLLMVFGLLEYGLLVRDDLTIAAMSRDTARAASAFGDEQYADFKALQIAGQTARALPVELIERISDGHQQRLQRVHHRRSAEAPEFLRVRRQRRRPGPVLVPHGQERSARPRGQPVRPT